MVTTREQMVDLIFTLSEEQLEQLREWINENVELEANSKDVMNKVIDNAIAYNSNFLIIKKFIDEYDFYSLLEHGAPKDEFDSYSRELADKISFKDSVENIAERIAVLLDNAFSEEIRPEKYINIAEKIKKALFEKYLVCVKDSYEGFVKAVLNYTEKSVKRNKIVSDYLIEHPEALSADILEFISDQEDFYEDVLAH